MLIPMERTETFTYTSPKGVVFVITDVPALVFENEDGVKEVRFKPASSRVINKYVREGLNLYSEPSVYSVSFEQAKEGLAVDAQVRFVGERISLNNSPLDVWRTMTFLLQESYDLIKKPYKAIREIKKVLYPTVVLGAGSLIFGLKAHPRPPMFENSPEIDDLITDEIQVLQLLIDGHAFVNGEKVESQLLLSHPQIQLGVVRAVEKLSPKGKSEIEEVQIVPKSKLFASEKSVVFTPETHFKAVRLKEKLEKTKNPGYRDVMIVGQIETLSRSGKMTLRNIEYNYPEFKNYQTTALFVDSLWETLTSFFKQRDKRLMFRGIEFEYNGEWSNQPMIKRVEEAPPFEEVELAASEQVLLS